MLTTADQVPNNPSTAETATEPDYSLTNAEAIARFKELDDLRLASLRSRDQSLLETVFTPQSPAGQRVRKSIRRLEQQSVLYRTRHLDSELFVRQNDVHRITVEQRVTISPKFVDESGRDVTGKEFLERQTIRWTLRLLDGVWLIQDALIVDAQRLNKA
jgi:hypothetical protein